MDHERHRLRVARQRQHSFDQMQALTFKHKTRRFEFNARIFFDIEKIRAARRRTGARRIGLYRGGIDQYFNIAQLAGRIKAHAAGGVLEMTANGNNAEPDRRTSQIVRVAAQRRRKSDKLSEIDGVMPY